MDTPKFYFTNTFREFESLLIKHSIGTKRLVKGSVVFSSVEPLDFCLYIQSGLISYSVVHSSGAEKTLFYHGEGSLFPTYQSPKQYRIGEVGLALTGVKAFIISQEELKALMNENVKLMRCVLDHYMEMFNFLIYDSIQQSYSSSYVRLCNFFSIYLENRLKNKDDSLQIKMTQEELSRIIGVSRVQIGSILNRLRSEKIIETVRGKIYICDREHLIERCTDEAYIE